MTLHLNKSATRLVERELLPFLRMVRSGYVGDMDIPPSLVDRATELIELFTPPKPSFKKRASKKAKKDRLAGKVLTHREATTAIRVAVFARAGECCEFCLSDYHEREMHHLESGNGRRRQLQAIWNCVVICGRCHREYHRCPEDFRDKVIVWAARHGYPIPSRFRRPPRSAALSVGAR